MDKKKIFEITVKHNFKINIFFSISLRFGERRVAAKLLIKNDK